MLETELQQFQSIIDERTAARLVLDGVLIRGHVPERYQSVRTYVETLDRCIAELEEWSEAVRGLIERSCCDEVGISRAEDHAWRLVQAAGVWSWITSMRQERDLLASELAAIDELSCASYDLEVLENGFH